jgi:hypothetical protein
LQHACGDPHAFDRASSAGTGRRVASLTDTPVSGSPIFFVMMIASGLKEGAKYADRWRYRHSPSRSIITTSAAHAVVSGGLNSNWACTDDQHFRICVSRVAHEIDSSPKRVTPRLCSEHELRWQHRGDACRKLLLGLPKVQQGRSDLFNQLVEVDLGL